MPSPCRREPQPAQVPGQLRPHWAFGTSPVVPGPSERCLLRALLSRGSSLQAGMEMGWLPSEASFPVTITPGARGLWSATHQITGRK